MNKHHAALLWVPVLAAAAVLTGAGTASAGLPAGTTPVNVTPGNVTPNIDAHLHPAASIAGTVKSTSGSSLFAVVSAYVSGVPARSTVSDSGTGAYKIVGLFAKTYTVCVSGASVFSSSATGYLGRCWKTAPFTGAVPGTATKIALGAGQHKTGINIKLPKAAAISGKVSLPSGGGAGGVSVYARNRSTGATSFGFTTSNGTYSVKNLPASATGYSVCFNAFGGSSGTGVLPRCYKNKAWSGGTIPSTTTKVTVSLGQVHTRINQTLSRGGAISGKITDLANGNPLNGVGILVFTAGGKVVGGTSTNQQGRYVVRGLSASTGYRVCAAPDNPTPAVTYHGKCWKNVAWNGGRLPQGTAAVSVRLGATHAGISLKLSKTTVSLASISGTVTAFTGGAQLQNATVTAFRNGVSVALPASTAADGSYTIGNLRPGSGYTVCVSGASVVNPVPPPTGFAPRCFGDVAWNGQRVPAGATKFALSAGQNKGGVDIALRDGGEIDGTTYQGAGTGSPANGVTVDVYTPGGAFVASGFAFPGYTVKNLSAGNYIVCFDGRSDTSGGSASGYLPQCFDQVAWSGT